MMKYYLTIFTFYISILFSSAQFSVSGGIGGEPIPYTDNVSGTGIEKIYILNTLTNATITYTTDAGYIIRFYKYTRSESDKELVLSSDISTTSTSNSTTYTIRNIEDSKGYFAEWNGKDSDAIWIIDYTKHKPQLNSIQVATGNDICEEKMVQLLINKSDNLPFFAKSGTEHHVIRKYDIDYDALVWDNESEEFIKKPVDEFKQIDIGTDYPVTVPLGNTQFKLSGDQFAKKFGMDIHILSPEYKETAVEAHIVAEQLTENNNTDTGTTSEELEAPVEFQFLGKGNDAVDYYTWLIYKDTDPENPVVRFTDRDIRYTFRESGKYKVVLEVANRSVASCIDSTSYEVSTSTSTLKVPNFLVLDGEHQFRVTYKSLISFKCTIFNRWGNKIYEFSDPAGSWDGRYKGRYVTPGVYFYVIRAKGADGENQNKSGDINVLRPK